MECILHSLFYGKIVDSITLILGWTMAVGFYAWFLTILEVSLNWEFWIPCLLALGYGYLKEKFN